jgi:hypothetical protein
MAEFVCGTNRLLTKPAELLEVGNNYFVHEDYISRARVMCDLIRSDLSQLCR